MVPMHCRIPSEDDESIERMRAITQEARCDLIRRALRIGLIGIQRELANHAQGGQQT